ncbi:unnamed protein product [Musa hybrid cultivar]
MRVSPWDQSRLVEQEVNPEFPLASRNEHVSHGCSSFVCFGRASSGVNGTSPPKVGPVHHYETPLDSSTTNSCKESATEDVVVEGDRKICRKSSLKKQFTDHSASDAEAVGTNGSSREVPGSTSGFTKRKLQWSDACGKELVEIKEFELRVTRTDQTPSSVFPAAQQGSTMDYRLHDLRRQRSCACPPLHFGSWCNSRCGTADFNRTFADDYNDELDPLNYRPARSRLRGLWRRIVRGPRRIFISSGNPMHVSYDPYTYAQNFDEGSASVEPDNLWRSFSARFAAPSRTTRRVG